MIGVRGSRSLWPQLGVWLWLCCTAATFANIPADVKQPSLQDLADLAAAQDQSNAKVSLRAPLPQLTPAQSDEARRRAEAFIPKPEKARTGSPGRKVPE